MTPNLTPDQREAVERLRSSIGIMGYCPWETAAYQGLPWATPLRAYHIDCEKLAFALIDLLPMLTAPTCGTCGGSMWIYDAPFPNYTRCPDCGGRKDGI